MTESEIIQVMRDNANFQTQIMEKLSDVQMDVKGLCVETKLISKHQESIDQSISKLYARSEENKSEIAQGKLALLTHTKDCPAIGSIAQLTIYKAKESGAAEESRQWKQQFLYPGIKVILIIVGAFGMYFGRDIIQFMGKIL